MEPIPFSAQLSLNRCPHCSIARPVLGTTGQDFTTKDHTGLVHRAWRFYVCSFCGGVVMTGRPDNATFPDEIYPPPHQQLDASIPATASSYLQQAMESIHAPAGAVMLAASAVDAMLKAKNYTTGTLYSRIEEAAKNHLITSEMAAWAHDVRLDANDQRHADVAASLPTTADAQKCVEFARALAEFLFVLPARVQRGRQQDATVQTNP